MDLNPTLLFFLEEKVPITQVDTEEEMNQKSNRESDISSFRKTRFLLGTFSLQIWFFLPQTEGFLFDPLTHAQ